MNQTTLFRLSCFLLALGLTQTLKAAGGFAGSSSCASCHEQQFDDWKGSHHELAMQHASEETVLGNFNDQEFTHSGVTSRFFKKDGKFLVHTDGRDGVLKDFEIKYVFGLTPLQQYLVEFPDGRIQTLGTAWDSRPADSGGQRWFHVYPEESIDFEDELHWTGPQQNWNFMCADCHSTNLKKGYSSSKDTFNTTWSEISVGCEACHGPGSEHIAWAGRPESARNEVSNKGLSVDFNEREAVNWTFPDGASTAERSSTNDSRQEIEACASCHSRRGIIREGAAKNASFLDHYIPALLTAPLYHADGQIQDEVYVWGSFTQSRMYAAGVTCSDCHDPHNQQLRAPGDAVCAQCHLPVTFATTEHHHHAPDSSGASCLNCHMPETTYMVVDPRRDHSLRIPRPDHSVRFGTPNACVQCHDDKNNQWAAEQFENWYPNPKAPFQGWTSVFHQARNGDPASGTALAQLVQDTELPGIARATAVAELRAYLDADNFTVVQAALRDKSPLVRIAALQNLNVISPESRMELAWPLLQDPLLAVRTEAARVLADAPSHLMNQEESSLLENVLGEYIATQQLNSDRVESQNNLGNLYSRMGEAGLAEKHYRTGTRLDTDFAPTYINLSDLYRAQGMDDLAVKALGEGIGENPEAAALHHSLGLALVRQGKSALALEALNRASALAPEAARYVYVYGIALNSVGKAEEGISVLESGHRRHPNDRDILFALVTMNRDAGNVEAALGWVGKLVELDPSDSGAQQLLQSLNR